MTAAEIFERIAARRRKRGQVILDVPWKFKLCRGCQSIVFVTNIACPFCRGYGFDSDSDEVVEMARLLGERPLAWGCAVLPRRLTELKDA